MQTSSGRGLVVGVLGGSGGCGASSFAAEVAAACGPALLVDLDVVGGGLDVLLGIENVPGCRWSGLRLGGGRLDPTLLTEGVPRWRDVGVLAADTEPAAADVRQVVAVARSVGHVVLDLPRAPVPARDAAVQVCDVVLMVVVADVRPLAAAGALVRSLPPAVVGLVVRRGPVPVEDVAAVLERGVVGELAAVDGPARMPRSAGRVAAGIRDGLVGAPVAGAR